MTEFLQLVIYGTVLGGILTLGAIGASLVFGILRFAHFAHGDLMTLGAYGALMAAPLFAAAGLPVTLLLPVGMAAAIAVALAVDRAVYRQLRRANPVILLISSYGIGMAMRALVQLIWGPDIRTYDQGIQMPYRVAGLVIKPDHIVILAVCIVLVIGVHLFLSRTRMGKAMRAMADNIDLALVSGIPADRVVVWTWAIAGALAGAGGVLLGIDTQLRPEMGHIMLLPIFAGAILGGFGKPYGAIVGAMALGIVTEVSTMVIDPAYKQAVAFVVLIVMLIIRPEGLLRGAGGGRR